MSVIDEPDPAPVAAAPRPSRGRRIGAVVLLWLAGLLMVVSMLAIWVNRQVLDPDAWSATSTQVIANPAVRTAVSTFAVNQLYAKTDVSAEVRKALPPKLAPLAGPIAGGLHQAAQKGVYGLLGTAPVQTLWRASNRAAIRQFDNIVEGHSGAVTSKGDAVILDVRSMLVQVAQRLGIPSNVVDKIPENAGQITVVSGKRVKQVKGAVKLLKGLAIILPIVSLLLAAAAIWLSEGRRRRTLWLAGIALVASGLFMLIARNVAGNEITGALAADDATRQAVHSAWSILTQMLSQIAQSTILFGLAIMLGASLAGPRRWAVATRRAAAPWLRERQAVAYGVVAAGVRPAGAVGPGSSAADADPGADPVGVVDGRGRGPARADGAGVPDRPDRRHRGRAPGPLAPLSRGRLRRRPVLTYAATGDQGPTAPAVAASDAAVTARRRSG